MRTLFVLCFPQALLAIASASTSTQHPSCSNIKTQYKDTCCGQPGTKLVTSVCGSGTTWSTASRACVALPSSSSSSSICPKGNSLLSADIDIYEDSNGNGRFDDRPLDASSRYAKLYIKADSAMSPITNQQLQAVVSDPTPNSRYPRYITCYSPHLQAEERTFCGSGTISEITASNPVTAAKCATHCQKIRDTRKLNIKVTNYPFVWQSNMAAMMLKVTWKGLFVSKVVVKQMKISNQGTAKTLIDLPVTIVGHGGAPIWTGPAEPGIEWAGLTCT